MNEHWEIRRTGGTGAKEQLGLAERLQAARRWRGLGQWAAAREIGVSRKTLSRIENGYMAHANTRARVRRWLEEQEAARAAAEAAARTADPAAGRRVRLGRVKVALEARRVAQRKLARACRRARAERRQVCQGAGL